MRACVHCCLACAIVTWPLSLSVSGQEPANGPVGVLPLGTGGKPLNLDFEKGTLENWTATGTAFERQPIKGNTVTPRRGDMASGHVGQYWIGGFEVHGNDQATGTLTSAAFKATHPFASFRVGGGPNRETRLELVLKENGQVIFTRSGSETENLKPVAVNLQPYQGREIFIRLVDEHTGHWGHVNFDDFKFHLSEPKFNEPASPPPVLREDDYPFAGLAPEEAAKQMKVPEGFSVILSAGEPDVKQPIAMALDDRGRLWVAEAYTYPIRAAEGQGKDRILIFEDVDGDGKFDRRKVFMEGLNLVSGLEVGFGGVWVGAVPYLLFVPDRNHDDVPDGKPEVLLDGFAYQDTHETLNTFSWGPDGWLYGCHGVFTHSNVGKPGAANNQRTRINAGIWRYHPTRHVFEIFGEGTSNPWGVDFDDYGQTFCTACVIPHLYHVIQGARYQRQAGEHFNPFTYDDIQTIALHRHWMGDTPHGGNNRSDAAGGGHAHAGAMIYLGGAWPEKYRNQIFMNNIHGQRINMDLLARKGSGYVGDRAPDFCLARDRWSQILNLRYGPDGQAYMIDWYDLNACHHAYRARSHERAHFQDSVSRRQAGAGRPAKAAQREAGRAAAREERLVRAARAAHLQERGPDAAVHAALAKMAVEHADPTRRLRALWALFVSGGLTEELALKALGDQNEYVRGWTIQLALEKAGGEPSLTLLARMVALAKSDPSQVVRLYLASAAQHVARANRWDLVAGLLAHAEDGGDHNLPLMYWYAVEPLAGEDPARMLALAARGSIPTVTAFAARRVASLGTPEALDLVSVQLGRAEQPAVQLAMLQAMVQALQGRRQAPMPKSWPEVSARLMKSAQAGIRSRTTALSLTFGDRKALASMRVVLADERADLEARRQALASLAAYKDGELAPTLHAILATPALRGAALRGLAAYDHPDTPAVVLKAYPALTIEEKRDALATLAARAPYALALLSAVGQKRVPPADVSADLIRQLRNHRSAEIDRLLNEVWGTVRDVKQDKAQLIAQYTKLLKAKPPERVDLALGRALFVKTCQQCHTLFGTGGKVGPELTGSNRADLDYLLSNVLDPSAVMAREYQPSVIVTEDGRLITGIVKSQDGNALTVQAANEVVIVPRGEVASTKLSPQSMMPDDILKPLSDRDVRSLVAYLASPSQTALLATSDTVKTFFNGQDLTGWQGGGLLWKVEGGELVGKTSGLDHNEFLKSELLLGDFRLKLQVKLVDNQGNSGIQFRSEPLPNGEMKGYQADIGAGWRGKLYEEHGRATLWDRSGESHVRSGDWNEYRVEAIGSRIRTWINGQLCVDLDDPPGARRGIIALQLHDGGPTEVRYKDLQIELVEGK